MAVCRGCSQYCGHRDRGIPLMTPNKAIHADTPNHAGERAVASSCSFWRRGCVPVMAGVGLRSPGERCSVFLML